MSQLIASQVSSPRFNLVLIGLFALLAVLLEVVGLYGVIACLVGQRTRETGIRLAIGATRKDIIRMIVLEGMRVVGLGLLVGVVLALLLARFLESLFYGVAWDDPLTIGSVSAGLGLAALLAIYLLARWAGRLDPVAALRHE